MLGLYVDHALDPPTNRLLQSSIELTKRLNDICAADKLCNHHLPMEQLHFILTCFLLCSAGHVGLCQMPIHRVLAAERGVRLLQV